MIFKKDRMHQSARTEMEADMENEQVYDETQEELDNGHYKPHGDGEEEQQVEVMQAPVRVKPQQPAQPAAGHPARAPFDPAGRLPRGRQARAGAVGEPAGPPATGLVLGRQPALLDGHRLLRPPHPARLGNGDDVGAHRLVRPHRAHVSRHERKLMLDGGRCDQCVVDRSAADAEACDIRCGRLGRTRG